MSRPVTEQAIAQMTGLKIVPGTLNVRMDKPFTGILSRYVSLKELGGIPDIPNRKGLRFGAIRIAGRFAGFAFQGDEPEYSPFNVELISVNYERISPMEIQSSFRW